MMAVIIVVKIVIMYMIVAPAGFLAPEGQKPCGGTLGLPV